MTSFLATPHIVGILLATGKMVVLTAQTALVILVVALGLAFLRLVKGPSWRRGVGFDCDIAGWRDRRRCHRTGTVIDESPSIEDSVNDDEHNRSS